MRLSLAHSCLSALVVCSACAAAGGQGQDDSTPRVDAAEESVVDSGTPPRPDANAACDSRVAPLHSGTPLDDSQFAYSDGHTYFGELTPSSQNFQRLFIALHAETGVFSGAIKAGTYNLVGSETDYQDCGACVYLAVENDEGPSTLYMAESGVLRLDSVGAEIHGELGEATLREIDIEYTGAACPGSGEWPCGNTACSGGSCGEQVETTGCRTLFDGFSF